MSERERAVLFRLLEDDFPGRNEIMNQINNAFVKRIDRDGSLSFELQPSIKANVIRRIPVEAQYPDSDGTIVHVLLHVVNGVITELEVYKDDGSPIINAVGPENLEIIQLGT
jgi:hypothetical protein